MLRFDLDDETETIRNHRQRVKQAEALGHYALAEQLRSIIPQEQESINMTLRRLRASRFPMPFPRVLLAFT